MGVLLSGDITLRKRYTSSLTGPLLGPSHPAGLAGIDQEVVGGVEVVGWAEAARRLE